MVVLRLGFRRRDERARRSPVTSGEADAELEPFEDGRFWCIGIGTEDPLGATCAGTEPIPWIAAPDVVSVVI